MISITATAVHFLQITVVTQTNITVRDLKKIKYIYIHLGKKKKQQLRNGVETMLSFAQTAKAKNGLFKKL